jgi:hypothetical protein
VCDLRAVRERAEALHARRFGVADAAHVAFAEATAVTSSSHVMIDC